jgi:hypothetical protein
MENKKALPEWMKQQLETETVTTESPLAWIKEYKVYNKWFGKQAVTDPALQWKIITKTENGWEAAWEKLNINVLCIRKAYTWFVPRVNEFWDAIKDAKWNAIKDLYYTPEVDIYSKDNIALSKFTAEWTRETIWRMPKADFDNYIKQPTVNWAANPLFKELKTSPDWDRYTVSWLSLSYIIYAIDTDTKDIIRIYPGWSFGRFNETKPDTFETMMKEAKQAYFDTYGMKNMLPNFVKAWLSVKNEEWINYFKWSFEWFIEADNQENLDYIRSCIVENNKMRHTWIDFDQPLQLLAYNSKVIEAPKEVKVETNEVRIHTPKVIREETISIDSIPF